MVDASSTAPFSIGSSSMDMSLDELIKARRATIIKNNTSSTTTTTNRRNLKSRTGDKNKNTNQQVQRSIGAAKAKRNAKTAARRGLAKDDKPTPMDVEKEVYRQQRAGGGRPPRRSDRITSARTKVEKKVKAKNLAERRKAQKNKTTTTVNSTTIKAPSKKIVNAAVRAMKDSGFNAPKGMKMVISFKPVENNNSSSNNNGNSNSNRNSKGRSSNNNRNNQRGGRGRGGGGGRQRN